MLWVIRCAKTGLKKEILRTAQVPRDLVQTLPATLFTLNLFFFLFAFVFIMNLNDSMKESDT